MVCNLCDNFILSLVQCRQNGDIVKMLIKYLKNALKSVGWDPVAVTIKVPTNVYQLLINILK